MNSVRLDTDVLAELKELLEDEFDALIETYVRDSQEKLKELEIAVLGQDYKKARTLAHSLKGSSVNLGVVRIGELFHLLEEKSLSEDLSTGESMLAEIQQESSAVFRELNALI